jgi:hypothetical protein
MSVTTGGRLFFTKSERNFLAFSCLYQTVKDTIASETKQANPGNVDQINTKFRLKAYSLYDSNALASFLAIGALVVCHATRVEILRLGNRMDRVPRELLSDEDYTESVATIFELIVDGGVSE